MHEVSGSTGVPWYPGGGASSGYRARHWVRIGLAVMFILIGVAIAVSVIYPIFVPGASIHTYPGWPFGLFWGILWILILLWIASWFFRWALWPVADGLGNRYRYRRRRFLTDSASDIARERYARGEITREQYTQIMHDLDAED